MARFTHSREDHEEGVVARDQQQRPCRSRPHRVAETPGARPEGLDRRAWVRRAGGRRRREHHPGCDRDRRPRATALNTARSDRGAGDVDREVERAGRRGRRVGPWMSSIAPPSAPRREREGDQRYATTACQPQSATPRRKPEHGVGDEVPDGREHRVVAADDARRPSSMGTTPLTTMAAAQTAADQHASAGSRSVTAVPIEPAGRSRPPRRAAATTPACTSIAASPAAPTWLPRPRQASAGSTPRSRG